MKLCPRDILKHIYESGSTIVDRPPVSQSYQEYDTDKNEFPITQPLLKKEGLLQCSGEAVYSDDDPTDCNEVFAALVLAKVNQGEIESIDKTEALVRNHYRSENMHRIFETSSKIKAFYFFRKLTECLRF